MQRVGMLVVAAAATSDRRPGNLERAARDFGSKVQRKTTVPPEMRGQTEKYLRSLRLWKRYGHLRDDQPLTVEDVIDVQDLWLADPRLPAATGAITPEVVEDIPQLAVSLKLVRDINFTRTDRGKALLATLENGQMLSLENNATAVEPNPLIVGSATQLVVLYALLEADGDFIAAAYEMSEAAQRETFKRGEFADELGAVCRELVKRHRAAMRTSRDRKVAARLEEWAGQIDRPRGSGANWGGGRPPEQLATLRLEPFVDLGLLTRMDRFSYQYKLDDGQREFFSRACDAQDIGTFNREHLVSAWCTARGERRNRLDPDAAWPHLVEAYEDLRSPLGQAPFIEVTLLAIGRLVEAESDRYFEIEDGISAITEHRLQDPKGVRMGMNRSGALTYMKLA